MGVIGMRGSGDTAPGSKAWAIVSATSSGRERGRLDDEGCQEKCGLLDHCALVGMAPWKQIVKGLVGGQSLVESSWRLSISRKVSPDPQLRFRVRSG
jgi:hypothetical protein